MVGMALPWRILSAGISPLWSPTAGWLPRQVPKFPKQFWHLLPCRDFPVALGGTMAPLRGLLSPGCVPGCVSHLSAPVLVLGCRNEQQNATKEFSSAS